jgi:hypothetical protein
MSIERRLEKLENFEEAINPEKLIILKVQYDGVRDPTDEEIEAAKKKFLEEYPGHQGHILLNFLHLCEERITPF